MTRAQLAEAIARGLRRPDLAEKMLTGWGTFLGVPAQRGQLIFGPSEGRNVTFVNPAAWLGRSVALRDGGSGRVPAVHGRPDR